MSYTAFMLFSLYTAVIVISAFFFSWAGCHIARYLLAIGNVMDEPNERSNHQVPVPRGGGIAVMISLVGFFFVVGMPPTILGILIGLAAISFMDDRRGVDMRWRLLIQLLAAGLIMLPGGIYDLTFTQPVFSGMVSVLMDKLLCVLILVGFTNLFNFMDGIDGITGTEVISIGIGLFTLSVFTSGLKIMGIEGLIMAAAMAGFLLLNWHPAKLFLGDVGSIPLGFLIGLLLLTLASKGYWAAALILPAYYLTDGGLTFLRRLLGGERVWEAHSKHAYQIAVRKGFSHSAVVKEISIINLGLIVLAALSVLNYAPAAYLVAIGYGVSFTLWLALHRPKQTVIEPA